MTTPHDAFVRACMLDVAVRKPGNVSVDSPGHRMQAEQFVISAAAAAGPLCAAGASVGDRIEAAVRATQAAVGCNTNLGIVLLCAPIACAAEARPVPLQAALGAVLAALTVDDARAAFRAIALARPAGLGSAPEQDVHAAPSVDLRTAMALAAGRDRVARQYRDGFSELFDAVPSSLPRGWTPPALQPGERPDTATIAAVQRLYLHLLAGAPDSHIVRKHGATMAQIVMAAAQGFWTRHPGGERLEADPDFAAWDRRLKADGVNPGTSADLTVATLMLAALA